MDSIKQEKNRDPFANIVIRDKEFLGQLQGEWKLWPDGKEMLVIQGNRISWSPWGGGEFHVISYTYNPNLIELAPTDFRRSDFGGFGRVQVKEDRLEVYRIIYDMNVPISVFARKDMLDKIAVPAEALKLPVNNMTFAPERFGIGGGFFRIPEQQADKKTPEKKTAPGFCPCCGFEVGNRQGKFCPECGTPLKTE